MSQFSSPSGGPYGVSARLSPCTVAQPRRVVTGSRMVDMSENPTSHVGSAEASASQSNRSTTSIAVSPPHGGITHLILGSQSMSVSSAARSTAGPAVIPVPSIELPTTTSKPFWRSQSMQKSMRASAAPSTPADGEVTPMRSPRRSGSGNFITRAIRLRAQGQWLTSAVPAKRRQVRARRTRQRGRSSPSATDRASLPGCHRRRRGVPRPSRLPRPHWSAAVGASRTHTPRSTSNASP